VVTSVSKKQRVTVLRASALWVFKASLSEKVGNLPEYTASSAQIGLELNLWAYIQDARITTGLVYLYFSHFRKIPEKHLFQAINCCMW
jgi:hypothetical protein